MGKAGFTFGGAAVAVLKDHPSSLPTRTLLLQSSAATPPLQGPSPAPTRPWSFPASEIHQISCQSLHLITGLSPFSLADNLGDKGASIQGSYLAAEFE